MSKVVIRSFTAPYIHRGAAVSVDAGDHEIPYELFIPEDGSAPYWMAHGEKVSSEDVADDIEEVDLFQALEVCMEDLGRNFLGELPSYARQLRRLKSSFYKPSGSLPKNVNTCVEVERMHIGPSVYFLCQGSQVVYVGMTKCLPVRVAAHLNKRLGSKDYKQFDSVHFMHVPADMLTEVESTWIDFLRPEYNKTRNNFSDFNDPSTVRMITGLISPQN